MENEYGVMTHKINHADIKDWAKDYKGELFDGILCDPPYELGFMGKSWDSSGIAFNTDMWADLFKLVKPGGHLLAFSGSRTYHRMACAIEDAGFEIRDMIEWVYGSGFPKSMNIGLQIDKQNGVIGNRGTAFRTAGAGGRKDIQDKNGKAGMAYTDAQNEWKGYGTALKPAHEPCVLARKPLEKGLTVATNALKHGTGGLNIDGSRIPLNGVPKTKGGMTGNVSGRVGYMKKSDNGFVSRVDDSVGRFPANLIHDGSDEVVGLFPDTKKGSDKPRNRNTVGSFGMPNDTTPEYADSGSAARFFYTAKASKSERNAGLEGFEDMGGKAGDLTAQGNTNPVCLTCKGSRFDRGNGECKCDTPNWKEAINKPQANHHPTVKPLSLTKYLATLIKPPTGGRLLVPFSGSGSEMIGALQAGWEYVEGVELTEEYIPIAEARIKYWVSKPQQESLL